MYASLCKEDELADLLLFVIVYIIICSALSAGPLASSVAQIMTDDRDRRAHDTLFPLCPRVMERWNTDETSPSCLLYFFSLSLMPELRY